jgi:hypothetical protein
VRWRRDLRVIFTAYVLLISAGLVFYLVVGLLAR